MNQEKRICENCGKNMPRAAYIPFNGGMIVCMSCSDEWENLGSPISISEYHRAISNKQDYQSDLLTKK
jgi:hypothetical protein